MVQAASSAVIFVTALAGAEGHADEVVPGKDEGQRDGGLDAKWELAARDAIIPSELWLWSRSLSVVPAQLTSFANLTR